MTAKTIARTPTNGIIALKGVNKSKREGAYLRIAPLSFVENLSRVETIANLQIALGAKPTDDEVKVAQVEWTIGRVASRLPAGEFPKDASDNADKLEYARKLVTLYAAPPKEGTKARKLRAGQLGRRSPVQHKVVRAAEEAWSQVKAELGHGTAQTQAQRNAAKPTRATNANPVRGDGKGATPDHARLVTPAKAQTVDEVCAYVTTQAATLLAFANKNARLLPTDFGQAIQAFKSAINAAANAHEVRKAEAEGRKAEKQK